MLLFASLLHKNEMKLSTLGLNGECVMKLFVLAGFGSVAVIAQIIAAAAVAQSGAITNAYRYDARGRLVSSCEINGSDQHRTVYALDDADNRNQLVSQAGAVSLNIGESRSSENGQYVLVLQPDGNLVFYDTQGGPNGNTNVAIWNSVTYGTGANFAAFQTDGNLVVYKPGNVVAWHSFTYGNSCSVLALQNDGHLVIRNRDGKIIWDNGAIIN